MCYTVSSIDDVRELVTTVRHVSTYMDPSKLSAAACGALHSLLKTDVTAIALANGGQALSMQCVWGAGEEFSEMVTGFKLGQQSRWVADGQPVGPYRVSATAPVAPVSEEGTPVQWVINQPVVFAGETIAVLFAGQRGDRELEDRVVALIREFSASIAPIMAMSIRAQRAGERARLEERRRIAQNLHDTAGQILFSIGLNANKLQVTAELGDCTEAVLLTAKDIAVQAAEASECLRSAFLSMVDDSHALPVTIREYSRLFSRRTEIPVEFVEVGHAFATSTEIDTVLCAVVREGLHNAEKHADATFVFVTLTYRHGEVALVVQDDGVGMAKGVDPISTAPPQGLGLPSLFQRVESVGGTLQLADNEDGGVSLRVNIPVTGDGGECAEDSSR